MERYVVLHGHGTSPDSLRTWDNTGTASGPCTNILLNNCVLGRVTVGVLGCDLLSGALPNYLQTSKPPSSGFRGFRL